MFKAVSANVS